MNDATRLPTAREHTARLIEALRAVEPELTTVEHWGRHLARVLGDGGRVLACGNGGSAADAQHFTAELVGRYRDDRAPFSAICLSSETSSLTAIGNDYGYDEVFARQVRGHGRPGDVLLAISTSGTSANVLRAAEAAREVGVEVWSLTGPGPNALSERSDASVCVDAPATATVQEVHGVLVHAVCAAFDRVVLGLDDVEGNPTDLLAATEDPPGNGAVVIDVRDKVRTARGGAR
ncbi:D-sedoheptulose-7-phosphate isomerase [Egicoccus halophilus]|uniref:Phosphoheptose isomerase n=1 Tax=Egicoccus halophilus TaxID=1670830 RepID=A0A8J3ETT4_9ACTN|nr:SIS domain-containing protein [Egicoccus halophilus]GGI04563.1 phosphoheptose isomerase [Egicoccus halophilus]